MTIATSSGSRVNFSNILRGNRFQFQVVAISVGIQHCAAIGGDGRLFGWGFNPSGQLGIGNDRNAIYPICVLENVCQVVCGVHNTWAIASCMIPSLPAGVSRNR
jgi:alpha-tubulin suppressor-like RCC1 family protein